MEIERLGFEQAHQALPELIEVLWDAVDSGASIGFLPPFSTDEASLYWHDIFGAVRKGTSILLVARTGDRIVGTVQLAFAMKPNASHRAEVQKLLVHRTARRQGIGKALMNAVESAARESNRSLLLLDTRTSDPSEQLYETMGYSKAGQIPHYAQNKSGELQACTFFYKLL